MDKQNIEQEIQKLKESIKRLEIRLQFNVGDRVQFKYWDEMQQEYGLDYDGDIQTYCYFKKGMKHLCGTYAIIKKIDGEGVELCDFTANGRTDFCYSFDMLKPAKDEHKWVFTKDEKVILRNVDERLSYIARDYEDNSLYLYMNKPSKESSNDMVWSPRDGYALKFSMYDQIFSSIKWTDDEPCEFRKFI